MDGIAFKHVGSQTVEGMGSFMRGLLEDIAHAQSDSAVDVITANNFDRKIFAQDSAHFIDLYVTVPQHTPIPHNHNSQQQTTTATRRGVVIVKNLNQYGKTMQLSWRM